MSATKTLYAEARDLEKRGKNALIVTRFSESSFSKSLVREDGRLWETTWRGAEGLLSESYTDEEKAGHRRRDDHRADSLVFASLPVRRRPHLSVCVEGGSHGRF